MSQHLFSSEVGNKKFEVIMGWDNPTKSFFLIIFDKKSDEDYPVYTNLDEMMPQDLDYYVGNGSLLVTLEGNQKRALAPSFFIPLPSGGSTAPGARRRRRRWP